MYSDDKTARFHVEAGPDVLFERVRFIMSGKRELNYTDHFHERAVERSVPLEKIAEFDSAEWEVRTAEVKIESGKFVSSAWRRTIEGTVWWIIIGFGDTVVTAFEENKAGLGSDVVQGGMLYAYVKGVNRKLMNEDT